MKEIEVTPEMIEAGVHHLYSHASVSDDTNVEEVVIEVFRAMAAASMRYHTAVSDISY